jgi:hypothetical protein
MLFGFNLYVWSQANINYRFVFEFDPRDNLDYHQFSEFGGLLFFLWSLAVYLTFTGATTLVGIEPHFMPLTLLVLVVGLIFLPAPVLYLSSRRWFLTTLVSQLDARVLKYVFIVC